MNSSKMLRPLMLLIALGFVWGSGYTLARYAMTHDVPALGYAFWQSLGPAILLGILSISQDGKALFSKKYWGYFLICGLTGVAIPNTNMYLLAAHMPSGILAVIVNTVPIIVYPLALLFQQEKADWWRSVAVMVGMIGIVFIINPGLHGLISSVTVIALITPLSFALCSLYINAKQPEKLSALTAAAGMLFMASLLLTPLVVMNDGFYALWPPFTTPQLVVILEIILSSLGYIIFFTLIRMAGPVFYSLTGGMVALTGLFWGYVVFNEQPTLLELFGFILIISGIGALTYRQPKQVGEQ